MGRWAQKKYIKFSTANEKRQYKGAIGLREVRL